ncbi:MAG TPA: ABC transporter ATP-binding protein [Actinophytocola sp.]|uniref:ABC transporter ATP-binding protein n=1 Tax=Actinophytocola sp. TaxID=1872138 RepID=UPI002F93EB2C
MRTFPRPAPEVPGELTPMGYLWWLANDHKGPMLLGGLYGVLCMLAQALVPAATGQAIDAGVAARNPDALLAWGGVVLGLGVVQAATGILRDRCALTTSLGARYRTVQLATRQAAQLGAALTRKVSEGEVVSVGLADVTQIGRALESTAHAVGGVMAIVATATVMVAASWPLGLVVLLGVPAMVLLLGMLVRPIHRRQAMLRQRQAEVTDQAVDIVNGLRVVRGIGGEEQLGRRYRAESQRARHAGVAVAVTESQLNALQLFLPGILVAVVVWLGAHWVLDGRLTPGQLVAFYAYAVFLAQPLRRLTNAVAAITKGRVAAARLVRLLSLDPGLDPAEPGASWSWTDPLADPASGVVLRPGRFTAVVATSTEDPATIADRLGRHVDSAATLGATPLSSIPVDEIRRNVLLVRNDDLLFSGTLRTELDPADRPERLSAMLDVVSARDVVDAVDGGLDHEMADSGRQFSGGQQQRLRLVRGLMADPEVLMLLEPTSAVDAHTEARVAARLKSARSGRTTAVFTTSPVLLAQADDVLLVESGQVVAEGSHHDLLSDARYRELVVRAGGDAA